MHVGLGLNLGVGLGIGRAGPTYAYNYVVWDGSGDQLDNATNLGLAATFDTFTAAFAFKITALPVAANYTLAGHTSTVGLPLVTINDAGGVIINTPTNLSTTGILGKQIYANGTIATNTDYVLHIAAQASTRTLLTWLNGALTTQSDTWLGTGAMPRPSAWAIGGTPGATTNRFGGSYGLAWFDVGQYITDATKFYPARALGANMENPGARPAIGFGDAQTATNWNAGTNLGDGTGTWTMTGGV